MANEQGQRQEPRQRPEGALIQERMRQRGDLSQRQAAKAAGLSEGRWRQIVSGYQAAGGGKVEVIGPPETLARMARVVGLAAEDLVQVGREDAAALLREESTLEPADTGFYVRVGDSRVEAGPEDFPAIREATEEQLHYTKVVLERTRLQRDEATQEIARLEDSVRRLQKRLERLRTEMAAVNVQVHGQRLVASYHEDQSSPVESALEDRVDAELLDQAAAILPEEYRRNLREAKSKRASERDNT